MRSSTRMTLAAAVATVLGSAPIGSTFRSQGWAGYAWFGVLVIMLAALLARRVRVPAVFVPAVAFVALIVYLTVAFTPRYTLLSLVPTPESLRELRAALQNGFEDVRTLTTPAPATPGLNLLAAGGVGLVAVVIDAVAVGLRRPAAAGLVLLAMYAVPTAVAFDGVGWLPFVLGACGYLVLLLAEGYERTLQWGRPVPYDDMPARKAQTWPVRTTGKRVGVAAVAVAILVPVVTPGFNNNTLYLLLSEGNGSGNGNSHRLGGTSLSPLTQMRNQLLLPRPQDVMTVDTAQRDPFYVRQMVLDAVDREGNWKRRGLNGGDDASGSLKLPSGTPRSNDEQVFRATFKIKDIYDDSTLPMYGLPIHFDGLSGNWLYNEDLVTAYSRSDSTRNLRYTESFLDRRPDEQQLASSGEVEDAGITSDWGRVPSGLPAQVRDTVGTVTEGSVTPYARTLAIFDYFLRPDSGFVYSLNTKPGTSGNDLVDFLTNKQGFCQQYASAMALMLRVAGVPARVAVGYTPGTPQDGKWVIRTDDAHAWVEAYFSGLGWVPFDPTPLPDNRRIEQSYAPRPGVTSPEDTTPQGADPSALPTPKADPRNLDPADRQAGNNATSTNDPLISVRVVLTTLVALLVLLVLLSPVLARLVLRRRRLNGAAAGGAEPVQATGGQGADGSGGPSRRPRGRGRAGGRTAADRVRAANGAWDEVIATAEDYRVSVRAADTPRATARRLAGELLLPKPAAAGLRLVALAEERARYAPTAGVDGDLPTAVRAVHRGLRGVSSRRRRLRAFLLPPSVLRALTERLARDVARTSTWVNAAGQAVRRPLPGSRR